MTGHQINSLVGDLVAMAQAMERLPVAEAELSDARQEITAKYDTIQRLELKLIERANEITNLHASIRELEVAKDAAETMFLEADDRTSRALDFVKTMFGSAGSLIQALEPPRAEPMYSQTSGGLALEPTDAQVESASPLGGEHVPSQEQSASVNPVSAPNFAEGQSEPDPIASMITQDPEPTRYDEHGNTHDVWHDWAYRTGSWNKKFD